MDYTIKQVSERLGLPVSTLRYYDKEGLMPLLKRTDYGTRQYSETDICWLELVCCLKNNGMPLNEIKDFMGLCLEGASTCEQRKIMLEKHKEHVLRQIDSLTRSLDMINYKLDHYDEIGIFHIDAPVHS